MISYVIIRRHLKLLTGKFVLEKPMDKILNSDGEIPPYLEKQNSIDPI